MTFLFVSVFPVVQQLQGIKYPFLFKWMNENMSEWGKTRGGGWGVAGPAKGDRGHPCVCQYAVWTLVTKKSPWKKKPSGTNWLLVGTCWYCFSGSGRTGGRGWNNTQVPTLLTHIHLSIDLEAQLAKWKTKKKPSKCTKMDWNSIIVWFTHVVK